LTKTRIEKLWDKLDELMASLSGNPHPHIQKAQELTQEIEQFVMKMRLAELKRKLRVRK
jgi:uncharacterized membrane protein